MHEAKISTLLITVAVLTVVAGALLYISSWAEESRIAAITNFDECAAAGYAIMESYPEQCRTPDGRNFVNDRQQQTPNGNISFNGCAVAGCSQTLCVSAEEAPNIVTTCEYRAEYACYKEAYCGPQADGKCGWSETPELQACLASPPPLQ